MASRFTVETINFVQLERILDNCFTTILTNQTIHISF